MNTSNTNNNIDDLDVTNEEFLRAIFRDSWEFAHVTSFSNDPEDLDQSIRASCWGGAYAKDKLDRMSRGENQFYTISTFTPEEGGRAVRRKDNFVGTFIIVADDVNEKIPEENAALLPPPSYKLLTSAGSEQWGWILENPCTVRSKVENLLDGLVAKGLAPTGRDPGMKGVTRYVRMPGGSNTKAKRCDANGKPFANRLISWNPSRVYTLEALGTCFDIDVDEERKEKPIGDVMAFDEAKQHPIFNHLNVTGYSAAGGWIRVDCPNVANHSADDASGAAVRIADDGRVMFQCHHGACNGDADTEKLTGTRVVALLDKTHPGLKLLIKDYARDLNIAGSKALVDALGTNGRVEGQSSFIEDVVTFNGIAETFNPNDWVYLTTVNRYYNINSGSDMCKEALNVLYKKQFSGAGIPPASEQFALTMRNDLHTAEGLTWMPAPYSETVETIYRHDGKQLVNLWKGFALTPIEGSVDAWLDLLKFVYPVKREREKVIQWLAYLVQHPDRKCQWHIITHGAHGTGKDSILKPIQNILGSAGSDVNSEDIKLDWGDFYAKRKLVVFQEIYHPEDKRIANKLKTLTATTSSTLHTYNLKGGKIIEQPDVLGIIGFSNHKNCLAIEKGERRYMVTSCWGELPAEDVLNRFYDWLDDNHGSAKLFGYLLKYDLTDFNPAAVPIITNEYHALIGSGTADYLVRLDEWLDDNDPLFCMDFISLDAIKGKLTTSGYTCGDKGIRAWLKDNGFVNIRGMKKIDGKSAATAKKWTRKFTEKDDNSAHVYGAIMGKIEPFI